MGRSIRKVFVPFDNDSVILSADYSQIELRVLAHMSEDENIYVEKVTLNGKELTDTYITHNELMKGGNLVFTMSADIK